MEKLTEKLLLDRGFTQIDEGFFIKMRDGRIDNNIVLELGVNLNGGCWIKEDGTILDLMGFDCVYHWSRLNQIHRFFTQRDILKPSAESKQELDSQAKGESDIEFQALVSMVEAQGKKIQELETKLTHHSDQLGKMNEVMMKLQAAFNGVWGEEKEEVIQIDDKVQIIIDYPLFDGVQKGDTGVCQLLDTNSKRNVYVYVERVKQGHWYERKELKKIK